MHYTAIIAAFSIATLLAPRQPGIVVNAKPLPMFKRIFSFFSSKDANNNLQLIKEDNPNIHADESDVLSPEVLQFGLTPNDIQHQKQILLDNQFDAAKTVQLLVNLFFKRESEHPLEQGLGWIRDMGEINCKDQRRHQVCTIQIYPQSVENVDKFLRKLHQEITDFGLKKNGWHGVYRPGIGQSDESNVDLLNLLKKHSPLFNGASLTFTNIQKGLQLAFQLILPTSQ